jgi:hypothetical protein
MNDSFAAPVAAALISDLRAFGDLCEEALALAQREHQALASQAAFSHQEFDRRRTKLLPDIELLLGKFRSHRVAWGRIPQSERERFHELKRLFQNIQNLLMKIILLDRENQQAMLKQGMIPVNHLPAAGARQPHYVENLYRKNSLSRT